MSQNRGYRRDNRSSYQLGNYGGRSGGQMSVNPWEGGMVPGGVRSGVAGLLPTPTQTGGLISQLSSPEAQLAIASNLLTTLLRPQQQQNQVPSLLSLSTLGQVGNVNSNYRQSGFGHDQGRYQDRGLNRRSGRMDQRRMEPYGKGRHLASSKSGPERKSGGQGYRSPLGKNRPGSKVGSKAEKKDEKDAQKDKDEEKGNKNEDDTKREDEDGKKEKKDEEEDDDESDDDDKTDGKKSRYHGIPDNFFFCHVCKKHMWDDRSFRNHLKGRTHHLMMDKLDESYKIKVELMRHELKVAEQQREIEMERIKRQGRKVHMTLREYCTMCDLHFYGNIVVHRKNERHQQLKSFLHPKCTPCGKEFASRIEWDHHRLTPLHLRNAAETFKNRQPDSEDDLDIEELIVQANGERYIKKDMKVRSKDEEEKDIQEVEKTDKETEKSDAEADKETEKNEEEEVKEEAKEEGKEENDKVVTKKVEFADDSSPGKQSKERVRIPRYNPDVSIAPNLVKKIDGFTCRACRRFFVNEEDSETHCRTLTHYNNYVTLLKMKLQSMAAQQKREGRKEGDGKIKRNAEDKIDDEGNWKRRKVSDEQDEDEDANQESELLKDDEEMNEAGDDSNKNGAEEKYDPLEADAEADKGETQESEPSSKVKAEDEKIWSEVDSEMDNLLESIDKEMNDSDVNDQAENDQSQQEQDAKDEKSSRSTRGSTGTASNRGSTARGRGRKRK